MRLIEAAHSRGVSGRGIGRALGIPETTVRRIIRKIDATDPEDLSIHLPVNVMVPEKVHLHGDLIGEDVYYAQCDCCSLDGSPKLAVDPKKAPKPEPKLPAPNGLKGGVGGKKAAAKGKKGAAATKSKAK